MLRIYAVERKLCPIRHIPGDVAVAEDGLAVGECAFKAVYRPGLSRSVNSRIEHRRMARPEQKEFVPPVADKMGSPRRIHALRVVSNLLYDRRCKTALCILHGSKEYVPRLLALIRIGFFIHLVVCDEVMSVRNSKVAE